MIARRNAKPKARGSFVSDPNRIAKNRERKALRAIWVPSAGSHKNRASALGCVMPP